MANIFQLNFRPSEIILDRVLNPSRDHGLGQTPPDYLIEACGIVPDFFCNACVETSNSDAGVTLDAICDAMDEAYGFGGFAYPFRGTLDAAGVYTAANGDDEPLAPLARFGFESRVFCFVYDYGITAIRIGLDGPYRIGRFD